MIKEAIKRLAVKGLHIERGLFPGGQPCEPLTSPSCEPEFMERPGDMPLV